MVCDMYKELMRNFDFIFLLFIFLRFTTSKELFKKKQITIFISYIITSMTSITSFAFDSFDNHWVDGSASKKSPCVCQVVSLSFRWSQFHLRPLPARGCFHSNRVAFFTPSTWITFFHILTLEKLEVW